MGPATLVLDKQLKKQPCEDQAGKREGGQNGAVEGEYFEVLTFLVLD